MFTYDPKLSVIHSLQCKWGVPFLTRPLISQGLFISRSFAEKIWAWKNLQNEEFLKGVGLAKMAHWNRDFWAFLFNFCMNHEHRDDYYKVLFSVEFLWTLRKGNLISSSSRPISNIFFRGAIFKVWLKTFKISKMT